MFKYPIFQTVLQNSFSYSYLMWGFIRWKVWIPDLHEAQESTVIAPNYLSPCLMGDYHSPASECRDERIIFMTPESSAHVASQEVWGLMIFVPPSPGLFLLLLMFRNCEQPGAPRLLPPRSPGTERRSNRHLERFWISSETRQPGTEMTGMRFYLISHNIGFTSFCLESLRAAGEVCNILSQSTFNRQINLSTLGPPYLATMKVWRNDSTLYWWRRKCGFSCHPFLKAATFFCRL